MGAPMTDDQPAERWPVEDDALHFADVARPRSVRRAWRQWQSWVRENRQIMLETMLRMRPKGRYDAPDYKRTVDIQISWVLAYLKTRAEPSPRASAHAARAARAAYARRLAVARAAERRARARVRAVLGAL